MCQAFGVRPSQECVLSAGLCPAQGCILLLPGQLHPYPGNTISKHQAVRQSTAAGSAKGHHPQHDLIAVTATVQGAHRTVSAFWKTTG